MKEKAPVPFGIRVGREKDSSTNLHADIDEQSVENEGDEAYFNTEVIAGGLKPLKEKAPVPFGIKIGHEQHSSMEESV